ncbi:MAG: hypothetical protein LBQ88_03595 [Treponema sp.]|jgi:hypothetical protein|nr:hypothetical protein [Treponema sp.]
MNYKKSAKTTENQIRKNGTKAILRIPTGDSTWDDDTASYIDEYQEYPGVCLVTNFEQMDMANTLIEVGDRRLLCVFPAEPKPKVSLVDVYDKKGALESTYTVISYDTVKPDATTTILFKIQGRKR